MWARPCGWRPCSAPTATWSSSPRSGAGPSSTCSPTSRRRRRPGLIVERGNRFEFRHQLIREALEAATGAARRALLHQQAARVLAGRPRPDPLAVALHARAGGDAALASTSFVAAAAAAAARFDVEAAEDHLAAALALAPTPDAYIGAGPGPHRPAGLR